ncbi:MAG: DUF4091 domain-containing protein [Planctomycetota bacterium]|jgi:hypothetical protein|nr:DUF4091 domain-containing protein [Planctomycetota bacterium]
MRAELRDSLEFLFPDSEVGPKPCCATSLEVARGGTVSVHVLLNGLEKMRTVRARVRCKDKILREARWFRLVDVPVEVNTGPVGFVEKEGQENPHVIRRAPYRVYDAMEPVGANIKASSATMAFRLQIPIARDTRPGRREYVIEARCGKEQRSLSLDVTVCRPVIPPTGCDSFPYTNWFSLDLMAERHALEPWSNAHWRMIRRYADLMAHGRQNAFWCPLSNVFKVVRGKPILDRERLRKIVKTFTRAGMHHIEGGHVAGRTGGEWNATTFDIGLTKVPGTSVEGNAVLAGICGQLMEEIERNGWRDRWIQHVADEPTATNAADYRILVGMVRKYMPGIPILDATMDPSLAGSVDIWCPQAQEYQRNRKRFEAQQKLGDQVWFYTCCFPGGPWLNRLLDMELLRPALFGWGAARYDLEGFLHWGLNHYRPEQDPFEQNVVGHGGGNCLPAGDTHIIYPGTGGPYSSLRLEAQREGTEDFELFRKLKDRDPKAANPIIRRAFRGFDNYTRNVKTFRSARKQLLERVAGL